MSKRDRDALSDAIGRVIDIHHLAVSVAPDDIATAAMRIIGFDYATHNAGWYGCRMHLLQLARERLRGRFDPAARAEAYASGQSEMFGDALQDRYPRQRKRDASGEWCEPEYVLRAYLTEADAWFNIDRLGHVSNAAARHKDALEAETLRRFGPRKTAA